MTDVDLDGTVQRGAELGSWGPAVEFPDHAVDAHDDHYALTTNGRAIHTVRGEIRYDTDVIGRTALCGRRMNRLIHPSDNGPMCKECHQKAGYQ